VFIICQAARVWIIRSLQGRWTTRIIVLPGIGPIQEGPYLILPHPNYLIVAFELAALPLLFGLYWTAWIFTVLNAGILLLIRIPEENRGLKWASSNGATLDREQQAN